MSPASIIRPLVAADRSGVFRILENAGNFTPEEVATALELIDEWLEQGEHSGYLTYVLESQSEGVSEVLGYVCFGPTPLTEATYDLYWIAVDKSKHRGGVGKRLMKFTEEEIVRLHRVISLVLQPSTTPEVTYREATSADVPAMERCRDRDTQAGPADARMAAYLDGKHHPQQALPTRTAFVALAGDDVVGYIAGHATERYGCAGEVQYLYVAPAYRRHRVAHN
ncbi:MAG: GNAT family N-acetyltransferase, partial [Gemmatimonadaceae bacterium]